VSLVADHAAIYNSWQSQYVICGAIGLVMSWPVGCALSATAQPADVSAGTGLPSQGRVSTWRRCAAWRQCCASTWSSRRSASRMLLIYYTEWRSSHLPVTIFGFTLAQANQLGTGLAVKRALWRRLLSDGAVRKPFMLAAASRRGDGAGVLSSGSPAVVRHVGRDRQPDLGNARVRLRAWMAAFTETVEAEPALTGTGPPCGLAAAAGGHRRSCDPFHGET